jgi:hypothetical protein
MHADIFRPVPVEARRENLAAYLRFLNARDGAMDLEKRQLSRREEGMLHFEKPLPRIREMDRDLFATQYDSYDPGVKMPLEMVLLLALVKMNGAEAFGVNANYEKVLQRALKSDDPLELMLLIEETYHTRILLSAALSYGIELKSAYKPPTALRALIGVIGISPTFFMRPLTLTAELLGVSVFLKMLEQTRVILRHDPELRDAVEERLCEILTDEIGHVSYNRLSMGAAGLAQARVLLPVVAATLAGTLPELKVLGVAFSALEGELTSLATTKRLPEQVVRSAFIS